MAHNLDPIAQYRLVHEGIRAVAARCDGAVTLDMKGFDGQDTHYGRRIAGVLFEKLTADDHVEIARIANKYRAQIGSYTGIDVTTLDVVTAARELTTNHQSRQNARRYEKLAKHLASRKVTLLPSGKVGVSWASKGDPDFSDLVSGAQKLPGRFYNRQTYTNEVNASPELLAFAEAWDMEVPADVIAAVEGARTQAAPAAAPQATISVGLVAGSNGKRLWFSKDSTRNDAVRAAVMALPGRRWTGENNEVDAGPEVTALCERFGLVISDRAQDALKASDGDRPAAPAQSEKERQAAVLSQASRAASIEDLPAEFLALVRQAVGA